MCFQCTGGLSAVMCKLFMVINYITDNIVNLPWVVYTKKFKLSLDLEGGFGFVATMMASNSNRIGARGCIA